MTTITLVRPGPAAVEAAVAEPLTALLPESPEGTGYTNCPNSTCKHLRTSHSFQGCGEWLANGKECSCKKKYMEL